MTTPDPKKTPARPWPDDVRQLTEEEARDAILFGTHKDTPNFKVDGTLLGLMEKGVVVIGMDREGVLCVEITPFGLDDSNFTVEGGE